MASVSAVGHGPSLQYLTSRTQIERCLKRGQASGARLVTLKVLT